MQSTLRPALVLFGALTLVCGVLYPLAVTGLGQILYPHQAAGSMIERDGIVVGSHLIGQSFTSPKYFWGRPSATAPMANNGAGSGGANLGPTNPAQIAAVKGRVEALKAADPGNTLPIPVDLVTASASGLDPEISVAAARYQSGRVAAARGISVARINTLVEQYSELQLAGVVGESRVNVLALNLALDAQAATAP
ncbi:potassium-transporting ATPase subunit KdpC [Massilia sp. TSP1-1-2]|uniref:potassium-transporting ATPase subunit KdpC n=1 Tax=unclassified Massilia TaxID=2609279 RepID=UPI003CF5938C